MSAFFLCKKIVRRTVCLFSCAFVAISCLIANVISRTQTVYTSTSFYFLVSDNTHTQVSAHWIQLMGGAGYLLCLDNREYAAYAVYLDESKGESALRSVQVRDESAKIYSMQVNGCIRADSIRQGALNTLLGNIQVVSAETERLAQGATQQSCRRILQTVQKQLRYMAKTYTESFPTYAQACFSAEKELEQVLQGIIFVRDLRHFLCSLCVSYLDLQEKVYW